jgi:glutamate synthase (NADPH/NADH) small chain
MKLDKSVIDRRTALMEKAGVHFVVNADIGKTIAASELMKEYDSIILACGASQPRDIQVPGRDAKGIFFAVDFLGMVTKKLLDSDFREYPADIAEGKEVLVIGGGDTGNDCVGTCIRQGAKSVKQLEMMSAPPKERRESNPWPQWPLVLKTDYGQEEAIYKFGHDPRIYKTTVKEFISETVKAKDGSESKQLKEVVIQSLEPKKDEKTGRMMMVPAPGTEKTIPAQLVLIAAGFLGSESYVTEAFGVEVDGRTNVKTDPGCHAAKTAAEEKPSKKKVGNSCRIYTAGDMHRGQSLVVWAISEGRNAAREIDEDLMGFTNL